MSHFNTMDIHTHICICPLKWWLSPYENCHSNRNFEILFLSIYKFGKRSSFNFISMESCFNRSETLEYDFLSNVGYSYGFLSVKLWWRLLTKLKVMGSVCLNTLSCSKCDSLFSRSAKKSKSRKQLGTPSEFHQEEIIPNQAVYTYNSLPTPAKLGNPTCLYCRIQETSEIVLNALDCYVFGNCHFRDIVTPFWF